MKLFELINTQTKTTDIKSPFDMDKLNKEYEKKKNGPESGSYARARPNKKDPHMYSKYTYFPTDLKKDAYYQYIKAIEPHIGSNPYFPRVYVVELIRDPQGQVKPNYGMEKLVTADSFDTDAIIAMGDRMFKGFADDFGSGENTTGEVFNSIIRLVAEIMEWPSSAEYIKDEELRQALSLIDKIEKSDPSFEYDMHTGNAMIRGTSKGPQFVLMDPLWDRSRGSQIGKK